jgi:DNA-binding transcriptional ArsR family regulator
MIEVEFDPASVARVRVALSPVFEAVAWLAVVAAGERHPLLGDPGAAARFALRDADVAATAAMIRATTARRFIPDFLTPNPKRATRAQQFDEQLSIVEQTPIEDVAGQILPSGHRISRMDRIPHMAANALHKFWRGALHDIWPAVDRTLGEQVHEHARQLAAGGVAELFTSMRPQASWTGTTLVLRKPRHRSIRLVNRELVVIPSLLTSHPLVAQIEDTGDAYMAVPARSRLLERLPLTRQDSLLGRSRTAILVALDAPSTTRGLARNLGLSEATVSHHLHALSRAGLATSSREGRWVHYSLTPLGRRVMSRVA